MRVHHAQDRIGRDGGVNGVTAVAQHLRTRLAREPVRRRDDAFGHTSRLVAAPSRPPHCGGEGSYHRGVRNSIEPGWISNIAGSMPGSSPSMSMRTGLVEVTSIRLPYITVIFGLCSSRCLPSRIRLMPRRLSTLPALPMTMTSNTPSVGEALGAMRIPPPKYWQLATTTCCATTSCASPSMITCIGLFFHASSVMSAVSVNVAPPERFLPELTRRTTSPPHPASAMLMKCRTWVLPSLPWYVTQPTSRRRGTPEVTTCTA